MNIKKHTQEVAAKGHLANIKKRGGTGSIKKEGNSYVVTYSFPANYTVKLNGIQKHIENKTYSAGKSTLYNIVLNLWNKYGDNEAPTEKAVLAAVNGDAFEIGSSDYTLSIESNG